MEFDWSTFGLEAINFVVLVWLLKRFFYQPVLTAIEKRRQEGARVVDEAEALRAGAESLRREYEGRLAAFEGEKAAAWARLDGMIVAERARRFASLEAESAAEQARQATLAARAQAEHEAALQREAVALAARFAARLLERLAGPELEAKLIDTALEDLRDSPSAQALRSALAEPGVKIRVTSAHPLDATRRAAVARLLGALGADTAETEFHEDPALVAGIRILAGAWVLSANLQDELRFFTEVHHDR